VTEASPIAGSAYQPLSLGSVIIQDTFWAPRIMRVREITLPLQHRLLRETGRLDALRLDWRPGSKPVPHIFWDSDVAKWVEAASYSLATAPDETLGRQVDEAIELLAGAQQDDGYLNTYFTVVEPGRRWTDLRDAHELYCAGHLIEAGVAHFEATGKRTLLDVVMRYADYIDTVFGAEDGQIHGYDGHEEIELALVKLYRVTGIERYLRLSRYFVEERGQQPHFFDREAVERGTPGYFGSRPPFDRRQQDPERFRRYNQSHAPVREQREVVGHAVRAMYLYSAVADVAAETGDDSLWAACRRLWDHLTARRMYVTGGIGSTAEIEGFTEDYDLPNESAYAETCAAIGLVFWAHRMAHAGRDRRYVDVLERVLYNGVLAGISQDGSRFFYDNPLASRGEHHRQEWFGIACCPPNLARLLTSLGRYVYSQRVDEAVVHLFVGGTGMFDVGGQAVTVEQRTEYPWDGMVELTVRVDRPVRFTLSTRIPGWCADAKPSVNGEKIEIAGVLDRGYARLDRVWRDGDVVLLDLPMPVRRCYAHPNIAADLGLVAIARGPLIYCFEGVDHGGDVGRLTLPRDAPLMTAEQDDLPGAVVLKGPGSRLEATGWDDALYRDSPSRQVPVEVTAVPYYSWDNRAPGPMQVWIREPAGYVQS
jgi:uncharacterized protein